MLDFLSRQCFIWPMWGFCSVVVRAVFVVIIAAGSPASKSAVNMEKANALLAENQFEDLLDIFDPDQVNDLSIQERQKLADIFYQAAYKLREQMKDISFSSLFCERGLLLVDKHKLLLKLQIQNYMHPDMRLFGGAEELSQLLVDLEPNNVEFLSLRGKVAFEQGEYEKAIFWFEKAQKAEKNLKDPILTEVMKYLELSSKKRREVQSALSMNKELENRLARAKKEALRQLNDSADDVESQDLIADKTTIVLYMVPWCQYCQKTRELLSQFKVVFEEKDIEKDPEALQQLVTLAEKAGIELKGIPVLQVGTELVVGYNPQRIESLIQQSR